MGCYAVAMINYFSLKRPSTEGSGSLLISPGYLICCRTWIECNRCGESPLCAAREWGRTWAVRGCCQSGWSGACWCLHGRPPIPRSVSFHRPRDHGLSQLLNCRSTKNNPWSIKNHKYTCTMNYEWCGLFIIYLNRYFMHMHVDSIESKPDDAECNMIETIYFH